MNRMFCFIVSVLVSLSVLAQSNGNAPNNLTTFDVDENSAILSWSKSNDAYKYIVSYGVPLAQSEITQETLDTFLIIGDLVSATQYLWRVRMIDYNFDTSDWSDYSIFVTAGIGGDCAEVSDLTVSQITANSISVQWFGGDDDVKYWEIVCSEVDENLDISAYRKYTKNTSVTFTNLIPSYIYKISARTHCSGDIGRWNSILVRCVNENLSFDLPITLSFEDEDTNGQIGLIGDNINTWTFHALSVDSESSNVQNALILSNTGGQTLTFDTSHASISYAYVTINVPEESVGLSLNFKYLSSVDCDQSGVAIFLTSAGSNVSTENLPYSLYQVGSVLYGSTDGKWQNEQIELPSDYAGQKMRLMFAWINAAGCTNNSSVAIDDICVKARYCHAPDSLKAVNVQSNSVDLYWFIPDNQTKYLLEYRLAGEDQWLVLNDVSSGYYLGDLEDNTTYEWRLKALCDQEESLYSITKTFTTKVIILPVESDSISYTVGYNYAYFDWPADSVAYSYVVSYRENDVNQPWTDTIVSNNYCTIADLQSNTEYMFKVRKIGADNVMSKYSDVIIFSTLCKPITQYPYVLSNTIKYNNQSGFVNMPPCYEQEYSAMTSVMFDFSFLDVPLLTFDLQTNSQMNVYISDDGGQTYAKVAQYEPSVDVTGYTSCSIILDNYMNESNVRLKFVFTDTDASKIMGSVKNLSLQNACASPAVINIDTIGTQSIQLSWPSSENVSLWTVRLYKNTNEYITQYYTSEPKIQITNLDSLTTYRCIIMSTCSSEISFDSSVTYFTTAGTEESECSIPKNFIAYWYPKKSDETILALWDANKDIYAWEVYYKELYAVNWQTKTVTVTPQFSIRNLEQGEVWLIKVRAICAPGDTSEFTQTDTIVVGNSALNAVNETTDDFALYPNPATETVTFDAEGAVVKDAVLLNAGGKVLYRWKELPLTITVRDLQSGDYYIVGFINDKKIVKRFIKQ